MMEIFKSFTFDAAHQLAKNVPDGHRYGGVHGHSFVAEVYVRGTPDPDTGWIMDLADVEAAIAPVRDLLDHGYLNDVEGLALPTLENIAGWLWQRLAEPLPGLSRIVIRRGSCNEGCVYTGPD
ncbi:MAG: 6-carboxytetrahydropterin synthase [Sphingomonadales bacterium]